MEIIGKFANKTHCLAKGEPRGELPKYKQSLRRVLRHPGSLFSAVIVVISLATCSLPWANRSTLQLIHSDDVPESLLLLTKSIITNNMEKNQQNSDKTGQRGNLNFSTKLFAVAQIQGNRRRAGVRRERNFDIKKSLRKPT